MAAVSSGPLRVGGCFFQRVVDSIVPKAEGAIEILVGRIWRGTTATGQ